MRGPRYLQSFGRGLGKTTLSGSALIVSAPLLPIGPVPVSHLFE